MDELAKIKKLESRLSRELEKSKSSGEERIQQAKKRKAHEFEDKKKIYDSEAREELDRTREKATVEAEKILSENELIIRGLDKKYAEKMGEAVDYILKELGV